MNINILAQIISILAMIVNMAAFQFKTKKQMFLTVVLADSLFVISYIMLKAYVGALTCGIIAIEIVINTIIENKGKKFPKFLFYIYLIISVLMGTITYNGFIDLLPIFASLFFVFSIIQNKEKNVRLLSLCNLILWVIYDLFVKAYGTALSDFLILSSTAVSIVRYDLKKET